MEKKCRVCLSMDSLFNWNECVSDKVSFADIFFRVTYFARSMFPKLNYLCFECGDEIINIYNFIRKATETDVQLKQEVYTKTLESIKTEDESQKQTLPDLTEILAQIDTSKITIKKIDFKDIIEDDELRNNPTVFNHLQNKVLGNETYGQEVEEEEEVEAEVSVPQDTEEYQYVEEEVITDLGFEPIDMDVVEVDIPNDCEPSNEDSEVEINEIILDSVETENEESNKKQTKRNLKASKECEYCGKVFSTTWSKNNHVMAIHGEQERSLCDECPRTFRDVWTLAKHKKTHDKNRKREYACSQCNLTFLTSGSLKGHMELHNDNREKKFRCDQCDKAFFQKGALNVHKRLHTGQLVQCEFCDKRYPRFCDLEKHMLTHTGENPYSCKYCDKLFKYSSSLYTHIRKQHFGYIYKCSYCSKQFEQKEDLLNHKIQHKLTPFTCALCCKECTKKIRLKAHLREVHKIEDPEEIESLIISTRPPNGYRRMRKFLNVQYGIPDESDLAGAS